VINTHMELLHAIYSDCSSTACEIFFCVLPAREPALLFLPTPRDTASFDGVAIRRRRRRVQRAAPRLETRSLSGEIRRKSLRVVPIRFFWLFFGFSFYATAETLEASETGKQTARIGVTSGVMDLVETTKTRVHHEDMSPTSRDAPDARSVSYYPASGA